MIRQFIWALLFSLWITTSAYSLAEHGALMEPGAACKTISLIWKFKVPPHGSHANQLVCVERLVSLILDASRGL